LGMKAFSIFFEIGKTLMCPIPLQLAHQLTKMSGSYATKDQ
jgi:hypothetical protein